MRGNAHERERWREMQEVVFALKEIAGELSLSEKTVSTYRTRILAKMGLKTNADLTYYAIKNQLIN